MRASAIEFAEQFSFPLAIRPVTSDLSPDCKMSSTRDAEEGLRQSLKFVYPLLRIIGAWPSPVSAPLSSKILERCLIFLSYLLLFLLLVPGILHILVRETNSRRQLKLFMPHINVMCQLFKYTIVLCRMNEFRSIMGEIKRDWLATNEEDRRVYREKAQIGHKVMTVIMLTIYTGGISYRTILPLSVGRIVLPDNTTIRLLPCPSYFIFFDEQSTPNYELIFVLQVLSGFFTYTVVSGTVGICTIFCLHTCSQLSILANKMTELTNQLDISEDAVQKKIVDIVEYRTKIKRRVEICVCYFYPAIYASDITWTACAMLSGF